METLEKQGGELDEVGRTRFERSPHFDALVELRRADDDAKVLGLAVGTIDDWQAALIHVASDDSSAGPPR